MVNFYFHDNFDLDQDY